MPGGGTVDPETGAVTPNEGGSVAVEDADGNTTTITPPGGGSVTPNDDGTVTVPDGSTVTTEDGTEITIGENNGGTTVNNDGSINLPDGGIIEVESSDGETTTITAPDGGGTVSVDENGGVVVPDGSIVTTGDGTEITIGENNGGTTVNTDGSVNLPEGGTVTIKDESGNELVITVPEEGGSITTGDDGTINLPGGSTVTDSSGNTTEMPEQGGSIQPGGDVTYDVTVTFDSTGGSDVDPKTTAAKTPVAEPEAPTRSGYSFRGWYTAESGGDKWDFADPVTDNMTLYARWSKNSSGVSTYRPTITASENGTATVSPSYPTQGQTVTITPTPDEGYEVEDVLVTDRNGNEIEVSENENGTYSFTQPVGSVTITVTFAEDKCDGTAEDNCPSLAFSDLNTSMWYHEYVDYAIENGLMVGTGEDVFSPDGTLTRAQAVTVLWRMENEPQVNYTVTFEDVAADQWYTEAISWAASEEIVLGNGDGTFGTDDPITREQLAAILYRYAASKGYDVTTKGDPSSFTDASEISDWAYKAMQWAFGTELMQGNGDGTINPTGSTRRCEFATMAMRFIEQIAK